LENAVKPIENNVMQTTTIGQQISAPYYQTGNPPHWVARGGQSSSRPQNNGYIYRRAQPAHSQPVVARPTMPPGRAGTGSSTRNVAGRAANAVKGAWTITRLAPAR
jgi:hypothetical protein